MVHNILSSLILVDQERRMVEVFPDQVRKIWNKWVLRVLVLLSLAVQTSLIFSGNRRKHIAKRKFRIFIWCAYLSADWIATAALGLLVDRLGNFVSEGESNEYGDLTMSAFWAPFMLLHLGGPDTITAYALADNELWLRHLLGVVVQTIGVIYITLLAWDDTLISYLTIPMLLCGIIKYGERSWVLMCANRDQFRDSVLADKDPGPSYANFMEEFSLKEAEGYYVDAVPVEEVHSTRYDVENTEVIPPFVHPDARSLYAAYYFFETLNFKRLFVDLILGFYPRDESQAFFGTEKYSSTFEVIEIELGFAYDVFYTKAPIIYTSFGLLFRLMTSLITLGVLLTFAAFVGVNSHKHQLIDVVITYILLIGAMLLEAFAVKSLFFSDWANIWFVHNSSKIPSFGLRLISFPQSIQKGQRWSNSMYQYSLLDFCLNQKSSAFCKISRFIPLPNRLKNFREQLENSHQLQRATVSPELKCFVFEHLSEKSKNTELDPKILFTCRGAVSLQNHEIDDDLFKRTVDVDFDHSILIWHIATDLRYNLNESIGHGEEGYQHMTFSKELADYMLYILVMCPFMLPMGIGIIRFRDTCAEALVFFKERSGTSKPEAFKMLGQVNTKVFPSKVKGDRSKSVLFEGCELAAALKKMDDQKKMWKMVADVWVEILGYAASQCRGFDHAQQLEKGGELLTHVWLLMAHLGITEHFKIKEGHGRVKLAVT